MKMKLPKSAYNWLSIIGSTIAIISFFMIIFLLVISTFRGEGGTYLGLVTYIVLPAFLIAGLILIPIGMWIKRRRMKKGGEKPEREWPRIDLNKESHKNAFMIFSIGTVIFLFLSAVGSYEAFHYTESVEFCGETCHSVMHPEYIAYQNSPHARVACVDCHVGEGADWYMRSKLSGLYQVYAVIANNYPKPIPTPIKNLRPARETCERCHWPEKFYSHKLRYQRHYLADENNTEWDITMIMRIGPEHSALGLQEGIHWHINPDVKVEYIATDDRRQNIPWVRYTNLKTGKEIVYQYEDEPLTQAQIDSLPVRTMDCMDCHNRPSHNYQPPAFFVNNAFTAGKIPKDLPEFKYIAMEICSEEFGTMDSAMAYIDKEIMAFYEDNYPDIYQNEMDKIKKGISGFQSEFKKNIFPDMKVRWSAYPNNIGHVEFDGCFRCHDNMHYSEDYDVIQKDCEQCHMIKSQGPPDSLEIADFDESLMFRHPTDIGGGWMDMLCTDCHTGLNP